MRQRLARFLLLSAPAVAIFSLWFPMILKYPEYFRSQFIGNILHPAGHGLFARAVMPREAFANQVPQLIERAHPIQLALMAAGLVLAAPWAIRRRDSGLFIGWVLAVTSVYLVIILVGVHPIQGYWSYTAGLAWLCLAWALVSAHDRFSRPGPWSRMVTAGLAGAVLIALIPGSGIRTVLTHVSHWNDPEFANTLFVKQMLRDIPPEARMLVGAEFVFDAFGAGRDVVLATHHDRYFDATKVPADYVILGRRGLYEGLEQYWPGPPWKTYGNRENELSNFAAVYRVTPRP
jgi:hypothetical protein